MNPWTALLESLHSATLTVLRTRSPDATIEVGLPSRHTQWELCKAIAEAVSPTFAIGQHVEFLSNDPNLPSHGFTGILLMSEGSPAIGQYEPNDLWIEIQTTAAEIYTRKGIRPHFTPVQEFQAKANPPPFDASRLVWIPIRTEGKSVSLFLAVR